MRHTFQITVDYNPPDRILARLLNHAEAGHSEAQARKDATKRLVLAQIDLHPDLRAVTSRHLLVTQRPNPQPTTCKVCGAEVEIKRLGVHDCIDGVAGMAEN